MSAAARTKAAFFAISPFVLIYPAIYSLYFYFAFFAVNCRVPQWLLLGFGHRGRLPDPVVAALRQLDIESSPAAPSVNWASPEWRTWFGQTALFYLAGWLAWGAIHTATARIEFFMSHPVGKQLYVALSGYSMLLLIKFLPMHSGFAWNLFELPWLLSLALGIACFSLGWIVDREIEIRAVRATDARPLVTERVFALCRHPTYLGHVLLFLVTPAMTWPRLFTMLAHWTYLSTFGLWMEERKLVRLFGPPYRDYQKRTPMLLPTPASVLQCWRDYSAQRPRDGHHAH